MARVIRVVALCALASFAVLLRPTPAAAQVRVGVVVGAPFVAAPVVVAPRRVIAPYYPPYAYSPYYYSPYYYPYAYASPYWGGYYGFSFGSYGRRYHAPRGHIYRGGGRYRR